MADKDFAAGLEIGATQIRCVVPGLDAAGNTVVRSHSARPLAGVQRGAVVDGQKLAAVIGDVVSAVERKAAGRIASLYLGLSPLYTYVQSVRATVQVSSVDHRVGSTDVRAVNQQAAGANIPQGREVVLFWPDEYIVDGVDGLSDPAGMSGSRLSVEGRVLIGDTEYIAALRQAVADAGYQVAGFTPHALALAAAFRLEDESATDAAIINFGSHGCELAYFSCDRLVKTAYVPLGSRHLVQDLSLVLKVTPTVATKLFSELDLLVARPVDSIVDLASFGHVESRSVSRRELQDICRARAEEIFALTGRELARLVGQESILDSVLVTGELLHVPGVEGMVPRFFSRRMKVASSSPPGCEEAAFSLAYGLAAANARIRIEKQEDDDPSPHERASVWRRMANLIRDFWE